MSLEQIVRDAWARGASVDLAGVGYGRQHWGDMSAIASEAPSYYRTLAGFAALFDVRSVLEIGTHWGGSSVAIMRGAPECRLVTIDITDESDAWLPMQPEAANITKIVGDGNDVSVIAQVQQMLPTVDMLYVDAMHTAKATLANFCHYQTLLRPKIALFDDITLPTTDMDKFWEMLRRAFPDRTINTTDVLPETRGANNKCGFGLWLSADIAP